MAVSGIDSNFVFDFFVGLFAGMGFFLLSSLVPSIGTIGIPNVPVSILAGDIGRFLIICIAAPVIETVFFQDLVLDFFDSKLVDAPFFVAVILASTMFALFHFVAYGGNLAAAGGSFISAGIASVGFCYLRKTTDSVLPTIVAHAVINFYIGFAQLAVVI